MHVCSTIITQFASSAAFLNLENQQSKMDTADGLSTIADKICMLVQCYIKHTQNITTKNVENKTNKICGKIQ